MSRKDQILDAALQCFTEHAIEGTSIEMICQTSGASVGSVYHHFKNKQGVVAALFVQGIRDYHASLHLQLSPETPAEQGIHNIVDSYLTWVAKNPDWARFVLYSREKIHDPGALAQIEDENQAINLRFGQWFQPQVESGAIQALPMEVFLALILGPAQLYARGWVSGRVDTKSLLKHRGIFCDAAWHSVRGV